MRTLMVCPQYYPIIGGYETLSHTLAAELCRTGVPTTVVTRRLDRRWARREQHGPITVHRLPTQHTRGLDGPSWFVLLVLFLLHQRGTYDVIHVHQVGWANVAAALVGRVLGKPVIAHPHSGSGALVRTLRRPPTGWLFRRALRAADAVVTLSSELADQARTLGVATARLVPIANTIDTARFTPGQPTGKRVLYVGRLSPEKGPHVLLTAWADVLRVHPTAELVLVGDGPLAAELHTQAAAYGTSVIFTGSVHSDIERFYQDATVFVLPSFREGVSVALLEALACGVPVVATAIPSIVGVLADGAYGRIVPIGDAAALAQALIATLAAPNKQASIQARARIVEQHSLEHVAPRYIALYHQLRTTRRTAHHATGRRPQ